MNWSAMNRMKIAHYEPDARKRPCWHGSLKWISRPFALASALSCNVAALAMKSLLTLSVPCGKRCAMRKLRNDWWQVHLVLPVQNELPTLESCRESKLERNQNSLS